MDRERLANFIGRESLRIVDAMARIDAVAGGVIFIVDEYDKLIGCVTDGDIRRWILRFGDLNALVDNAMNKNPIFLSVDDKEFAVEIMIRKSVTALPIVDNKKHIVDIVFLNDAHNKHNVDKSLSDVPVVIMAGGKGTRLYPYTKILPKPLIPIGDTPIVERIIDCYTKYGMSVFL